MLIPLNMFKPSSDLFADYSKAVLLLWIIFVKYVSSLSLLCCLIVGHLLGKGWPLGVSIVKYFNPSSIFYTDRLNVVLLLWIILLFMFHVLAALLSPAGKGLAS